MSKKLISIFSLLLVLLMCVTIVVACDGGGDKPNPDDDGKTKICLMINGSLGDKSFFDSANEGVLRIAAENKDIKVDVKEVGQDASKWEASLREICESKENYSLIIVGTDQMREKLQRISPLFPSKKFIIFDSDINKNAGGKTYPNVYSILFKQNEGSFLAGILAGNMLLETQSAQPTAGFVGGMKTDIIKDFGAGFYQGLAYVNENSNSAVKTHVEYIGGFNDSATAKAKALAMYNASRPANILFQAASQAGLGCIDAAKEVNKFIIGVDSDQYEYFVSTDKVKAERIVTSVLKRVDLALYDAINKFLDNKLQFGTVVSLGVADVIDGQQVIGLAKNSYYMTIVPENIRQLVDVAEEAVVNKTITVKSVYDMSLSEFNQLEDTVKV